MISPDYPPGTEHEREIATACVALRVTVVGNTQQADADPGPDDLRSFSSSYGVGAVAAMLSQVCQGGLGRSSWYGSGQVNAYRAVVHDTGDS